LKNVYECDWSKYITEALFAAVCRRKFLLTRLLYGSPQVVWPKINKKFPLKFNQLLIYAGKTLASHAVAKARAEVLSLISLKGIASADLNGKYKL